MRLCPPLWLVVAIALSLGGNSCAEQTASPSLELRFATEAVPFVMEYCVDCHQGGEDAEGGFDLEVYESFDMVLKHRARWDHLRDLVAAGAMPPADYEPRPSDDEVALLLELIDQLLTPECNAGASPGRVTMRRLSNYEYDNTIRDLLGVKFRPSLEVGFPSDEVANGFDNQGDSLSVSPLLLEKYLNSAEAIADYVLSNESCRNRLIGMEPSGDLPPAEALRTAFATFLPRAYRRPVEPIELQHVIDLCERVLVNDGSFDEAAAAGLQVALVSPHFLFRVERTTGDDFLDQVRDYEAIDPYALATRMAYFLWSSTPDESLYEAAASGELLREEVLREQVARMLSDKRSEALQKSFLHHWLGLDQLYEVQPDAQKFPIWSSWLREAMIEETERFFARLLRENRRLAELIRANESELNPRLAELYGLTYDDQDPVELFIRGGENESDQERRRSTRERHDRFEYEDHWLVVEMPTNRFGLLTHASVLTLTSNALDTSPVKRGKWILEALLGDPPPPAPPTVPSLEETAGDLRHLPLREQLAAHRSNPNCASCHVKMDPLGLALQNYDPLGRWRDQEAGEPIDAEGELDGVRFSDPAELAQLLASREEQIAQNIVRRLLSYALGRGLSVTDDCAVNAILEQTRDEGYRVQSLFTGVVLSEPFRMRAIPPVGSSHE